MNHYFKQSSRTMFLVCLVVIICFLFSGSSLSFSANTVPVSAAQDSDGQQSALDDGSDITVTEEPDENSGQPTKTSMAIASHMDGGMLKKAERASKKRSSDITDADVFLSDDIDDNGLAQTAHSLIVNITLVNQRYIYSGITIDKVFSDIARGEHEGILLGSFVSNAMLYTSEDHPDCFMAYPDAGSLNGFSNRVLDFTAATNNPVSPEVLSDIFYKNGVIYIPKSYYFNSAGEEIADAGIQVQALVSIDLDSSVSYHVTIESMRGGTVLQEKTIRDPHPFDVTSTFPVMGKKQAHRVRLSDLTVFINDSNQPLDLSKPEMASYDPATGNLTLGISPANLYEVRVSIKKKSVADYLVNLVEKTAYAGTSADDMKCIRGVKLKTVDMDALKEGMVFPYRGYTRYASSINETKSGVFYGTYQSAIRYSYTNGTDGMYSKIQSGTKLENLGDVFSGTKDTKSATHYLSPPSGKLTSANLGNVEIDWGAKTDWNKSSASEENLSKWEQTVIDRGGSRFSDSTKAYIRRGLIGFCCHVSSDLQIDDESDRLDTDTYGNAKHQICVLDIDKKDGYIIIGIVTAEMNTQSGCGIYKVEIQEEEEYVSLTKTASDPSVPIPEGYTFKGAVYDVFDDKDCSADDKIGTLTVTSDDGKESTTLKVDGPGTYYAKEKKAPPGFMLDSTTVYSVKVTSKHTQKNPAKFSAKDVMYYGSLNLKKESDNQRITNGHPAYTTKGIVYYVYTDAACTRRAQTIDAKNAELTIGDNDISNTVHLPLGTYYIREETENSSYLKNKTAYRQTIAQSDHNTLKTISASDTPVYDAVLLSLQKQDDMTGTNEPLGGASLAGAEYTISYYTAVMPQGEPSRKWILVTDKNGTADLKKDVDASGSDELYLDDEKNPVLPLGSITVQETKAPEGYHIDQNCYTASVIADPSHSGGAKLVWSSANPPALKPVNASVPEQILFSEQCKRANVTFTKMLDGNGKRIRAAFAVTNTTTGETHVITTDENGRYSSRSAVNPHRDHTNANDSLIDLDKNGSISEEEIAAYASSDREHVLKADEFIDTGGTWFGLGEKGSMTEAINARGAFVYGSYRMQELNSDTNEGCAMLTMDFVIRRDDFSVADESEEGADLGTLINQYLPEIGTKASDKATGTQTGLFSDHAILTDTVSYSRLEAGQEYTLTGKLFDKKTGLFLTDEEGNEICVSKTFTAKNENGTVIMEYDIDSTLLSGKTITVFEWLHKGELLIASHTEPEDEQQSISFPKIATRASADGKKEITDEKTTVITDTVAYENLEPGRSYRLAATFITQEENEEVLRNDEPVTGKTVFIPQERDGSVDVKIKLDPSGLAGKKIVCFESLYFNDQLIAEHTDLSDEEQTITVRKSVVTEKPVKKILPPVIPKTVDKVKEKLPEIKKKKQKPKSVQTYVKTGDLSLTGAIIAVTAAGAAFVLLLIVWFVRRNNRRRLP